MDKTHVQATRVISTDEQEPITGYFPEGEIPAGLIIDCVGYTPRFKNPIIRAGIEVFSVPADAVKDAYP